MTAPSTDLRHGLCAATDPHTGARLYDPDWWTVAPPADRVGRANNDKAKALCRQCPVRGLCAEYADSDKVAAAGHIYGGEARHRLPGEWRLCARPSCNQWFLTAHSQRLYCSRPCSAHRKGLAATPNRGPR